MSKAAEKTNTPSRQTANGTADMTLEVRDFGPIAEGKVDLRPLTVFAGPSNTGKSWMATLIYVLGQYRRFFSAAPFPTANSSGYGKAYSLPLNSLLRLHGRQGMTDLLEGDRVARFPEDPQAWIDAIENEETIRLTRREAAIARDTIRDDAVGVIGRHLQRCHVVGSLAGLIRNHGERGVSINFHLGQIKYRLDLSETDKSAVNEQSALQITLPDKIEIPNDERRKILSWVLQEGTAYTGDDSEIRKTAQAICAHNVYTFITEKLAGIDRENKFSQAYYLPAGRCGLVQSRNAIVSALLKNAAQGDSSVADQSSVLTGVVADFLEQFIRVSEVKYLPPERQGELQSNPDRLEGRILNGKIVLKESTAGYQAVFYQPKGWQQAKLPLIATSSMVAELAPVVLFLRYLVNPGDTLILEEPEAHLHPEAQQRFVEEIASWINTGIKVVLTTHSGWIVDGISNLVARGKIKNNGDKERASIKKEDVGVWLFEPVNKRDPGKGAKIRESLWERDEGGYEVGFYDIGTAMHNDWADSINRLNYEASAE